MSYIAKDSYDSGITTTLSDWTTGFEIWNNSQSNNRQKIITTFEADSGIFVKNDTDYYTYSNSGQTITGLTSTTTYPTYVTFDYDYYIDATDDSVDNWNDLGFRIKVQNVSDAFNLFCYYAYNYTANGNARSVKLSGTNADSATLEMADVSTSTTASYTYSAYSSAYNKISTGSADTWKQFTFDGNTSMANGTISKGTTGYFRFEGTLPDGGSDPLVITFNDMSYTKRSGDNQGDTLFNAFFTGTINCYIYDKSALQSYVKAIGGLTDFSPLSERYTDEAWSAYQTALDNAMKVLADQKTTQAEVDAALADLTSAHTTLNGQAALSTRVVSLTNTLHGTGDTSADSTIKTYYILAPLATEYTVPYDSEYYNAVNKVTASYTNTWAKTSDPTTGAAGLFAVTYEYWTIDQTGLDELIAEANELLTKDWCYNDNFKNALQKLYNLLVEYNTDYNDSPTLQSAVKSTVKETEDLIADESNEAYHDHDESNSYMTWKTETAATCTEDGTSVLTCDYCGAKTSTQTITAPGYHTVEEYSSYDEDNHVGYCTVCGTEVMEPHNMESEVHAATCTENSYTVYSCTICDYSYTVETPNTATGHTPDGAGTVTQAATCEEGGIMTYTCSVCGETYTEAIPATGHNYEPVVTAPTCTVGGYTTYTCKNGCGSSYVADETKALGHTWDEGVVTAPTCTEQGYTTYTCTVCGDKKQKIL
ncbi:MAG: FIVAR domain-containing protein [Clostridiales bacterium]|nr:FIVAR domain-containing protein [Clostridiales bacterium]